MAFHKFHARRHVARRELRNVDSVTQHTNVVTSTSYHSHFKIVDQKFIGLTKKQKNFLTSKQIVKLAK
jgi:hypothetical protein